MSARADISRIFSRKAIQAAGAESRGLKRALGAVDLVALGIGAIVGAGIFLTVRTAAAGA